MAGIYDIDILPMAKARGFPLSRVSFPASTRRAFYDTMRIWSYSLSTGVFLPASPAVDSQSSSHRLHGSRNRQWERERYNGEHGSVFTQGTDLPWNPQALFCYQGTETSVPEMIVTVKRQLAWGGSSLPKG